MEISNPTIFRCRFEFPRNAYFIFPFMLLVAATTSGMFAQNCPTRQMVAYAEHLTGMKLAERDRQVWDTLELVDIPPASPSDVDPTLSSRGFSFPRLYEKRFYSEAFFNFNRTERRHRDLCLALSLDTLFGSEGLRPGDADINPAKEECQTAEARQLCFYRFLSKAYDLLQEENLEESDRLVKDCVWLRVAGIFSLPNRRPSEIRPLLKEHLATLLGLVDSLDRDDSPFAQTTMAGRAPSSQKTVMGDGSLDRAEWMIFVESLFESSFILCMTYPDLAPHLSGWLGPLMRRVRQVSDSAGVPAQASDQYDWSVPLSPENLTGPGYCYFANALLVTSVSSPSADDRINSLKINFPHVKYLLKRAASFMVSKENLWLAFKRVSDLLYHEFLKDKESTNVTDVEKLRLLEESARVLLVGLAFSGSPDKNAFPELRAADQRDLYHRSDELIRSLFYTFDPTEHKRLVCFADALFSIQDVFDSNYQFRLNALLAKIDFSLSRFKSAQDHLTRAGGLVSRADLEEFRRSARFVKPASDEPCGDDIW